MSLTRKQLYNAAGVTELVDVENRRSEGATAIPENGVVSHSVEQLDDVEMGKTFDIAVGEMASAVDDEAHLNGMSNVLVFLAMRPILINVLRYS